MNFKIKLYTDPGHGWGAVKRDFLIKNGLLERISPFSYQKGQTVYLEEDRDLAVITTFLASKGIVIDYVRKHTNKNHPIRSYEGFKA